MPFFTPPTVDEGYPGVNDTLFGRLTIARGVSVLRIDGQWIETQYPTTDQIEMADRCYMGGHRAEVTTAEADELTLAGYAAYLEY